MVSNLTIDWIETNSENHIVIMEKVHENLNPSVLMFSNICMINSTKSVFKVNSTIKLMYNYVY